MQSVPLPEWPRAQLDASHQQLLSRGSRWKPAVVRSVDAHGQVRIVKDCRQVPILTRWIARILLARERRILLMLSGMRGFP